MWIWRPDFVSVVVNRISAKLASLFSLSFCLEDCSTNLAVWLSIGWGIRDWLGGGIGMNYWKEDDGDADLAGLKVEVFGK